MESFYSAQQKWDLDLIIPSKGDVVGLLVISAAFGLWCSPGFQLVLMLFNRNMKLGFLGLGAICCTEYTLLQSSEFLVNSSSTAELAIPSWQG